MGWVIQPVVVVDIQVDHYFAGDIKHFSSGEFLYSKRTFAQTGPSKQKNPNGDPNKWLSFSGITENGMLSQEIWTLILGNKIWTDKTLTFGDLGGRYFTGRPSFTQSSIRIILYDEEKRIYWDIFEEKRIL